MNGLIAQADTTDIAATWRLESHWNWAPWATVLFVLLVVGLVVYCYRREASPAGRLYRGLLGFLRLTTIALLLVMLSELLLSGTRSGTPRFGVVLDRSGSMTTLDPYQPDELPTAVREAASALKMPNLSRWNLARTAMMSNDGRLWRRLAEEFELDVIADLEPADSEAPASRAALSQALQMPEADEGAPTRIGDNIQNLVTVGGEGPPQGVLILTDGQITEGRSLSEAAETARRAGAPLYFLGLGRDEPMPDVELADLLADDVVFVDDLVRIQATLRGRGLSGRQATVVLRRQDQQQPLAETNVTIGSDGLAPIELVFRPEEPGRLQLTLDVDPVEGEADADNNQLRHTLDVRDAKLKVLLAGGYPNYEFRYLKQLLERDRTVELSTFLQEADFEYAEADATALSRFPIRRDELNSYDVMVMIDLDPRFLPRGVWADIRAAVTTGGAGLALVAGPRALPWAYREIADFAALIPVDMSQLPTLGTSADAGYAVTPTDIGLRAPAMQLGDSAADAASVWRSLAPLYWRAEVGGLKPAAQVLARAPSAGAGAGDPLIAMQFVGAGKVLFHAFDSSWRWRLRLGDVYFARYWVQSLRELARGKLAQQGEGIELALDRRRYEAGEDARLQLRLRNPQLAPPEGRGFTALLQTPDGLERRVELAPNPIAAGLYEGTIEDLRIGQFRAVLADAPAGAEAASVEFQVTAPPGEFAHLERNASGMQAAADRSRGGYYTLAELDQLIADLPQPRRVALESLPPVELWNRWPMVAAICGCLAAEWILRKRKAML